jgi:hypothetical protein
VQACQHAAQRMTSASGLAIVLLELLTILDVTI